MRALKMIGSVLLPVLLADSSLVASAFFCAWIGVSGVIPFEWFFILMIALTQLIGLPYCMGIISALVWNRDPRYDENLQENLGCATLGLWLVPLMVLTFGASLMLLPFLLFPYLKGVNFGRDLLGKSRWREWLGLETPEVEQRRAAKTWEPSDDEFLEK
jgi:hypothetical protein